MKNQWIPCGCHKKTGFGTLEIMVFADSHKKNQFFNKLEFKNQGIPCDCHKKSMFWTLENNFFADSYKKIEGFSLQNHDPI